MELWPFIPQRGLTESLEWLTDVIRCKAGEDRVALRHLPRQTFQARCFLDPEEYGRAKAFSRSQSQEFLMPMWPLCHNVGNLLWGAVSIAGEFDPRFFSGQVVIWEDSSKWEVANVESVDGSALTLVSELSRGYTNAALAPVQVVRFAQAPDFRVGTSDIKEVDLRTLSIGALQLTSSAEPVIYRGLHVLMDDNILVSQLRERHFREVDETDNRTGIIAAKEVYSNAETATVMSWHPLTRAELYVTLEWIHTRKGRRHAFWYRSHNADFLPLSALGPNTTPGESGTDYIEVERVDTLADLVPFDILIERTDGARRFYRVQATREPSSGRTALVLAGNAGPQWTLPEIARISFLVCVRFDADRIEIRHTVGGAATVSVPVVEVPAP